jgi:hypothetical protein
MHQPLLQLLLMLLELAIPLHKVTEVSVPMLLQAVLLLAATAGTIHKQAAAVAFIIIVLCATESCLSSTYSNYQKTKRVTMSVALFLHAAS